MSDRDGARGREGMQAGGRAATPVMGRCGAPRGAPADWRSPAGKGDEGRLTKTALSCAGFEKRLTSQWFNGHFELLARLRISLPRKLPG